MREHGVLVLSNSRSRGGLAAVRALGAAGWRIGVGTPSADGLSARSRWVQRTHHVPRPRGTGEDFVEATRSALTAGGYGMVVGAADDWAMACSTWADQLPARVGHPMRSVATRATDKLELARLASRHGLATPRTLEPSDDVLADWRGPAIVKCRSHWAIGTSAESRIEAVAAHDAASIAAAVERIRCGRLEPVVQEVVGGRLIAISGVMVDGRLRARVQQRASGTWPTPLGVSSAAITVPLDEAVAARCEALLAALGWEGLVELQFLDDGTGEPVLIDLNGRYFGSMSLAVAAGVNLPDLAALHSAGLATGPAADGRVGVRYVWAAGEFRRAWAEGRGGRLRDVLASFRRIATADVSSVVSWRDRRPAWWLACQRLRVGD